MTQTADSRIGTLRSRLSGDVVGATDVEYDDSRRVFNGNIDRRPLMVARCLDEADVQAAVRFATEHGLEVAVRGGAHSMSGASVVDDGIVIDISRMNQVRVDPEARRAVVAGGALLSDVDSATQVHGLAVPTGLVSHTGVGGLTLGGGMGWLTRLGGLTIDNVLSARVVTADGDARVASPAENPDLFWAIRGGGGNFGVVTEFEFALHQVGPIVHFGLLFWSLDQGAAALRHAREVMHRLPDDVNVMVGALNAPPAPFVPEQHQLRPGYAALVVGTGAPESHADVFAALRDGVPPLFDFATPMPFVELQKMLDEANAWGLHFYDKGCYVEELSDDVIDALTETVPKKISPLSLVLFYRLDGAFSRVAEDATAFSGGRSPRFAVFMIGGCPGPEMFAAEREWVRLTADALRPMSIDDGVYVNGVTDFDAVNAVQAAYGPEKYARLVDIKTKYDPDNVFRRNANIAPASL
ncbi:MAG: FAD-binding oxidoreductase [Nocardioidaceae bacterium]